MNPPPEKLLDTELLHLIKEAREGSQDALARAMSACWSCLVEIAARELEGRPDCRQEAQMLARGALIEVGRVLTQFDGSSEAELRRWLRHILLEQTREQSDGPHFDDAVRSTPDRHLVSTIRPPQSEDSSTPFELAPLGTLHRPHAWSTKVRVRPGLMATRSPEK
jgi:hypothetical protein